MTRLAWGWACALVFLAGCAGPTAGTILADDTLRGYRGVVLQEGIQPAPTPDTEGGMAWITPLWIPWRASFGTLGFVLSLDLRWFSADTSPWIIESGHYPLWEDVYAPDDIPTLSRPVAAPRNPGSQIP